MNIWDDPYAVAFIGGLAGWGLLKLKKPKEPVSRPTDLLDTAILRLSENDVITVRDILPGICVMGRSGSGKSSSSMRLLIESIVGLRFPDGRPASGGVWHASKPEDRDEAIALFKRLGREDDLKIIEPGGERMNLIEYVSSKGGGTRAITRTLMVISENLRASDSDGREGEKFWESAKETMIYNMVEIISAALGKVDAESLQRFRHGLAKVPEETSTPEWKKGFHNQCLVKAFENGKLLSSTRQHDIIQAAEYWLGAIPAMDNRTRSGIVAGVDQLLHIFNTGTVRDLCSTTTTVTPDDTFDGKWIFPNMPPTVYGDEGNAVNAGVKYVTEGAVLRRKAGPDDVMNIIIGDEYPNFFNRFDSRYVAECRSHKGGMLVAAQGRDSFYATLKSEGGRHETNQFLGQLNLKILHALGTPDDATYGSDLIGKRLQTTINITTQPPKDVLDSVIGVGDTSSTLHEGVREILQPRELMAGLRTGGARNDYMCDAYVVKSGEPFSNGENFLRVAFPQR